jgi:hypothetical protein
MNSYRYLYYKLYCIWLKKKDEPENAAINAVITLTFLLYVNLFSIPLLVMAIYKKDFINLPEINLNRSVWLSVILIGTGILNYFSLARKRQHDKIFEEFKMESKGKSKKGIIYTLLYLTISLGIPLYIFLFTSPL